MISEEEQIAAFEIQTGIALKQGDFVVFHPDKRVRKTAIEAFLLPELQTEYQSKGIAGFVKARIDCSGGTVAYVTVGRYFTGLEVSVNGMYFPLCCIKSINGKDIDYAQLASRGQS